MEPGGGFKLLGATVFSSSVSTTLTLAPPIVNLWPEFSPQLRDALLSIGVSGDDKPVHFFTKTLYQSDISAGLTRLLIPKGQIKANFLSDAEEALLRRKEKLDVRVVDPSLTVRDMKISRWKNGDDKTKKQGKVVDPDSASYCYSLIRNWREVVNCNAIVKGDTLQVWSFRYNVDSLGLILIKEEVQVAAPSSIGGSDTSTLTSWGRKRKRGSNSPAMK